MPERLVRPGILTSEKVNKLSWGAEIFYRRLMSMVDDFGRFDGRHEILRASLYPLKLDTVSRADVGKWASECEDAGLVSCYAVEEKEYIEIRRFNQRLRSKKSKYPPPKEESADIRGHPRADDVKCVGDGDGGGEQQQQSARARDPVARERTAPTEDQALAYASDLRRRGADYSDEDAKSAWLSLQASADDSGRWWWGQRPVSDWRAALESRMAQGKQRKMETPKNYGRFALPKSNWDETL